MFIELPDSVIRLVAEFGSAAPAKIRWVGSGGRHQERRYVRPVDEEGWW